MFQKKYRLKTRDVLFLTKKRQFFWAKLFSFFYTLQYPNLKYNQASFHVSIKYNKHSSVRNIVKRSVIHWLQQHNFSSTLLQENFYKLFIILNKNVIEAFQKQVANMDKKAIILAIHEQFAHSFTALQQHLWKSSKISSTTAQNSLNRLPEKIPNN